MGIERVAAPILAVAIPGSAPLIARLDAIVQKLQSSILTVEAETPIDSAGKLKSEIVIADFRAGLALTQSVLALKNQILEYDPVALQEAINAQVAAYNAVAKLRVSFKVVPIVPL